MGMGGGDRRVHPNAALSPRLDLALAAAIGLSLLLFFYHVRLSLKPSRFPFVLDAEQKDDARGHGLDAWEILFASSIATLVWRHRRRGAQLAHRLLLRRIGAKGSISLLLAASTVALLCLRRFAFPASLCSHTSSGWMATDVGYLRTHPHIQAEGVSLRTLCGGRVWEPHVAAAIEAHLYHQGRAIDVGAYVGYHTVRLAKRAAPFDVHAFEGRPPGDLTANLRRNNAVNVRLRKETIDEAWALDKELEEELLDADRGPIALAKIDCEGCELHFLRGARSILEKWHPVLIVEIQDDASRSTAKLGGQQMIVPTGSREDVLDYLHELGYTVEALTDEVGVPTWDYLAYHLG